MDRRVCASVSLLLVLGTPWFLAAAYASSIDYTIRDERVSVVLSLQFFQNATSMPSLEGIISGVDQQNLVRAMEEGLGQINHDILISSLNGRVKSSTSWLNLTINFDLLGTSKRQGDLLVFNCSWIPFRVSDDLRFGNLSYNLVGAAYVRPEFERYVDYEKAPLNATLSTVYYLSGKSELSARVAVNRAENATLLDFGNLAAPVGQWHKAYNVTKGVTTFSYSPEPALDLTMEVVPLEGSEKIAHASLSYNATLSANGQAEARGNSISIDLYDKLKPTMMLVFVLGTFVAVVMTTWKHRSRRRQVLRRRK